MIRKRRESCPYVKPSGSKYRQIQVHFSPETDKVKTFTSAAARGSSSTLEQVITEPNVFSL